MGTYSPGQKVTASALLQSVVLATGSGGTAVSAEQKPVAPARWRLTGFTSTAPTGTDGALLFYKGSKATGNLLAVMPIGEYTSDDLPIPYDITSVAGMGVVVEAVGIPGAVGNTVTVNLMGVSTS